MEHQKWFRGGGGFFLNKWLPCNEDQVVQQFNSRSVESNKDKGVLSYVLTSLTNMSMDYDARIQFLHKSCRRNNNPKLAMNHGMSKENCN